MIDWLTKNGLKRLSEILDGRFYIIVSAMIEQEKRIAALEERLKVLEEHAIVDSGYVNKTLE